MKGGGEGSAYKTESSSGYKNLSLSHDEEIFLLNPGNRWQWSTARPGDYLWQRTPVPTEHEAGWAQGLFGRPGEKNNLLLTPGFEPQIS